MTTATNDGELVALDALLLGATHIALFTADPGEAGSTAAEATYGSYARAAVTWGAAGNVGGVGTKANSARIDFPAATSGSNTITHWGAMTASTGGTMRARGTCSLVVTTGVQPFFAIGGLTVTAD